MIAHHARPAKGKLRANSKCRFVERWRVAAMGAAQDEGSVLSFAAARTNPETGWLRQKIDPQVA